MKKIVIFFTIVYLLIAYKDSYAETEVAFNTKTTINLTVSFTNPTCGKQNGIINIVATSGTAPYSFSITGFLPQPLGFFNRLSPGTYEILVIDANAESATENVTLTNIYESPVATATYTIPTGCSSHDATIHINGSNGFPPYLYSIDQVQYQNSNTFSNLTAGSYQYSVKDGNGCESPVFIFNNLFIPENCNIHTNGLSTSYTCYPFITYLGILNVAGGTAPYLYSLDGINYQTDNYFNDGLPAGNYIVWIKDAIGDILLYTVVISEKCTPSFNVTTITQAAHCGINGTISVVATNGWGPYMYSIDGVNFQTNNQFTGLTAGNYLITVKDFNNLTSTAYVILRNNCLTINTQTVNSSCSNNNGSISVQAANGVEPYLYSIDGVNFSSIGNFNSLLAGIYTITVKDASNSIDSITAIVENINGPAIDSVKTFPTGCVNNEGEIHIFAHGGNFPLLYSIDNTSFNTSSLFSGLPAGVYTVKVKDASNCISIYQTTISVYNNIIIDAGDSVSICEGKSITLNGSSNGESYHWNNSQELSTTSTYSPIASPIVSTTYYLTAIAGTCSKQDSVFVEVKNAPVANAGVDQTICTGNNATLHGSGGISCMWSPSPDLSNPGDYNPVVLNPKNTTLFLLMVTGSNGCSSTHADSVLLNVTPPPVIFAGNDTSIVLGQSFQLHAIDINSVGFNQYTWSPSIGLSDPTTQSPITNINSSIKYLITARTIDGCEGIDSIEIKVFKKPEIYVPTAFTPNGDGTNDILKAIPVGIKIFKYFVIYNRYGSKVFYTTNPLIGWNGRVKDQPGNTGGYIWIAAGVDFRGNEIIRKGSVLLIF